MDRPAFLPDIILNCQVQKINIMRHFCSIFLFLFSLACFSQETIHISIYPKDTANPIASDFAGLSFEKNCLNKHWFSPKRETLIQLFRTCGIKSLRVGANAVDEDTFSTDSSSTLFTRSELDNLFLFAKSAGCKIVMGINLKDTNYSLAATEASYVIQNHPDELFGFEVGNEPDLYDSNTYRNPPYTLKDFEREYKVYYDSIRGRESKAVFTGPASSSHITEFTEPFLRDMDIKISISMLTQHYYVAKADTDTTTNHKQIVTMLSAEKLSKVSADAVSLVNCAKSSKIPFRMSETNSLYHGGQWGVSNTFASALWALDYMYKLAEDSCAGVNIHGGLDGPYTVFSKYDNNYRANPIAYGILAFQVGSKGKFIASTVINDKINLDSYSVRDSLKNTYTTIINKDTLKDAIIMLEVRDSSYHRADSNYMSAEYLQLSSASLRDTTTVTLGGQVVTSSGTIGPYTWLSSTITSHMAQIPVPKGSAVVIRFNHKIGNSINDYSGRNKHFLNLYPNPASEKVTLVSDITEHSIISIYNLQGQLLMQQQVQQGKTDIDISELAKGVYILRLYSNARVEAGRIIKE